ncbi:hypothetical protein ACHQM5_021185 [Ranunculus cassubicifolius]
MGNCLVSENKFVQVMKIDGKILEYRSPLKVHQVVSEFPGHAISESLPVHRHLCSDTNMRSGHLYYLLPPLIPTKDVQDAKEPKQETGPVRIKIVITRQELKEILAKGVQSVDDVVSQLQNKERRDSNRDCSGWKPNLHSIPE